MRTDAVDGSEPISTDGHVFDGDGTKAVKCEAAHSDVSRMTQSEMRSIRARLMRLSTDDLPAYFRGVRAVMDDLDCRHSRCEEDVRCLRESLPQKLSTLRTFRKELTRLRETILQRSREYQAERRALIHYLSQNAEELAASVERVSALQEERWGLRAATARASAFVKARTALASSDFAGILDSIGELSRPSNCSDDVLACLDHRTELLSEIRDAVTKSLQRLFAELKFPLEEAVDMRAFSKPVERTALLLKCVDALEPLSRPPDFTHSAVVSAVFEPFERRFRFHFCVANNKTNDDSKPEWFFTQILSWLSANTEFLAAVFCLALPSLESAERALGDIHRRLVRLAVDKATSLLAKVRFDSALFSHLIDESVAFEGELRDGPCAGEVGCVLSVFCEEPYLSMWLELERDSCTVAVENLLASDDRWLDRYREVSDIDVYKVPECVDKFVLLLESVTERYRWIKDVDVQARFLELQIIILDDFRLRIVQISQQLSSPWEEPFIQLLNSFRYVASVLEEWTEAGAFVEVLCRGGAARLRCVFDDVADMYRHVWRQRASDMLAAFSHYARAQLTRYETNNWFGMEAAKQMELTPSFCPFLMEVRRLLTRIAAAISSDSAATLYRMLNSRLADTLLDMIASLSFNCHGASQMLFDITSSLVPLLNSLYTRSASVSLEAADDPKFDEMLGSLRLLAVPVAPAILLLGELRRTPEEMAPSLLAQFHAASLGRERALSIFKQRCDVHIDTDVAFRV